MTTFEEDVVECYYNLKGYLTVKNVCFSAVEKIKEYFKSSKWRSQLISSDFDSEKAFSKLSRRLKELGAEHEIITSEANKIEVRIRFNDKEKQMEIIPFSKDAYRIKFLARQIECTR